MNRTPSVGIIHWIGMAVLLAVICITFRATIEVVDTNVAPLILR